MKKLVQNELHWKDIQDEVYSQEDVLNLYDDYIAVIDAHNSLIQIVAHLQGRLREKIKAERP